jgi:hypothetical protein
VRHAAIVVCAAIGAGAIACSQTNVIEYAGEEGAASDAPVETNPYGAACPTQHLGRRPRPSLQGDAPGDVIANLKFKGYVDGDKSKGLVTVSLCDYFDPDRKKYRLLHLSVGARWCGPCNAEAEAIVAAVNDGTVTQKGVVFVQAIDEGTLNHPSSLSDLDFWVSQHRSNYTTVLDPAGGTDPQQLAGFFDKSSVPWGWDIDVRDMEILTKAPGFHGDIAGDVQPALDWVNGHDKSY